MTTARPTTASMSRLWLPSFVAPPSPCPYLPARMDRKLLVPLGTDDAVERYNLLSVRGWRRSHHWAYRQICEGCAACVPVRIEVDRFAPSRSQRRVAARNRTCTLEIAPNAATAEDIELFGRYLSARHSDGPMASMSPEEITAMIAQSPVQTALWRLRDRDGALLAATLVDRVNDGLSLVYTAFSPDRAAASLGVEMVLRATAHAREAGLPWVYLGLWVEGSRKMEYKVGFGALQALGADGWRPLDRRTVGQTLAPSAPTDEAPCPAPPAPRRSRD